MAEKETLPEMNEVQKPITPNPEDSNLTQAVPPPQPPPTEPPATQVAPPQPSQGSKSRYVLVSLVALVIIIGLGIVFVVQQGKTRPAEPQPTIVPLASGQPTATPAETAKSRFNFGEPEDELAVPDLSDEIDLGTIEDELAKLAPLSPEDDLKDLAAETADL